MDCTEPDVDVGAPDDPRDKSSINSQPQDIDEARDIDNSSTKCEPQDNSSTKDEAQDIGKKTSVNDEAEQICHNVSVPLFTAK